MKRKILVPMFASVMALSMNNVANADEVKNDKVENNEEAAKNALELDEYKETSYKKAVVKDGVAVKIREEGEVQHIAYTGDEFTITGIQGEWVQVKVGDGEGWLPSRFVDVAEASGFVTENRVNFRKEANTDAEIIKEFEKGDAVKVLEVQEEWIKVKSGEEEGFVSADFLSEKAPVIEVEVQEEETTTTNNQTTTNNGSSNGGSSTSTSRPNNNNNNSNSNTSGGNTGSTQKPADNNNSYNPPSANTSTAQAVVNLAYSKIGSPYVWGAEGPNAFDCSGLTSYVYRNAAGISLPRTSSAQSGYGQTVSKSNLQPGDLVFFNTSGSGVSHVGIYVGGGNMVHSPAPGQNVHVASIHSSYYASRFVTAKRVL